MEINNITAPNLEIIEIEGLSFHFWDNTCNWAIVNNVIYYTCYWAIVNNDLLHLLLSYCKQWFTTPVIELYIANTNLLHPLLRCKLLTLIYYTCYWTINCKYWFATSIIELYIANTDLLHVLLSYKLLTLIYYTCYWAINCKHWFTTPVIEL